ncbi:LPS export ABC transporter periplasmic protein LptC [uncultured Pluralibacter sp.]|uniref:LPS export ABC transporter periplasmic protein LptC n=1 Tax=uncultured Pluralibacter sp. TaxID=1490864 RepID=UPI00260AC66D|nr:LPS export ABC transporter periplasmic protein LptC [uncultured Pluralibacter sp.]
MSKTRRWVIILLSLLVLVFIGLNFVDKDDAVKPVANSNDPTYQSEHTSTVVYNPDGALAYHLIADHVEYFSEPAESWFTKPVLTTFDVKDANKVATWSVKADKAKLTNDRMLYLYGHVEINALTPDSQLRKITTDNAQVNLVTQDVSSDDLVTLYGTTFNSSGLKMRGNLRSKTAKLIEKVRTSYEIQNKQTQP